MNKMKPKPCSCRNPEAENPRHYAWFW